MFLKYDSVLSGERNALKRRHCDTTDHLRKAAQRNTANTNIQTATANADVC